MSSHDLKSLMQNLIASIFLIVLTSGSAVAALPEPCLKAQDNCTEWIALDAKGNRGLVYRTQPLTSFNPSVQKAVVVVHGQGRNADAYFRHMLAAAFLADALQNTLIISPRFASNNGKSCLDRLETNEVGWVCSGADSWRSGGIRAKGSASDVNSFDFMDAIVAKLADEKAFPNPPFLWVSRLKPQGMFRC